MDNIKIEEMEVLPLTVEMLDEHIVNLENTMNSLSKCTDSDCKSDARDIARIIAGLRARRDSLQN